MVDFEVIWKRIQAHSGEPFTQIRGKEFTYQAENGYIALDQTNQNISHSDFEKAFQLVPLPDTTSVQKLRGPSYIYAVLMDSRIRLSDW